MTSFWDADGDFDYEAHHEVGQRQRAAATAETMAKPHLADAIHHFGLADQPRSGFTPALLEALEHWQALIDRITATPADREVKHLTRHAEAAASTIETLTR
ncbi:hypothetical protein [Arthrobacter sp. MAHUQ-56]